MLCDRYARLVVDFTVSADSLSLVLIDKMIDDKKLTNTSLLLHLADFMRQLRLIVIRCTRNRQAHAKRMFVAPTRWLLLQDRPTATTDSDDADATSTMYDVAKVFEDLAVYPDSDVVLARRFDRDYLELISVYRPSPQRGVILEDRGNWTLESGLRMRTYDVASARRRNLQRTALKSCLVVL